ncbi:phosphoribosylformylglycinamide synthase [Heterostelium album PN500]|uniref:phosphoribosylformylglycinamidine synthase n=1 Tax=Heterostelium pallidum (strain ATCC 26659 / Pp 5 / PN500) TaxID=670386 RepID=D3BTI9_HETP5|nr:phosphoribosylformylglycinamide synthase [Heterostelium album PN500]EFA75406.1 phosphoribosylformylglycinamide synthase [Heterostelium album PN500]|eukprot:XP_020427540.1 phosphoribosylformylglycinamide synthase [Heterostelium album PN500]
MTIKQFYRKPALSDAVLSGLKKRLNEKYNLAIKSISSEYCFNVQYPDSHTLTSDEVNTLTWLLSETFEPHYYSEQSFLYTEQQQQTAAGNSMTTLVEVGPRMNFTTTYSTNATSICQSCRLNIVDRIERSRRYLVQSERVWSDAERQQFVEEVHDRMTECLYEKPISSFETGVVPKQVTYVPLMEEGRSALERINKEMGLAFDEADLALYTDLFMNHLKRNPSDVECFDIGQSNSEHSRHWFFNGKLVIDGQQTPKTLFEIVKNTLKVNPNNSLIAFCDNSSAINGFKTKVLVPSNPSEASSYQLGDRDQPIIFTAETHNFPSGVAPFPGAETGTGGRIRDTHATGRGSLVVAGTVGYCVGNLNIPGYNLPWEDQSFQYPFNLAHPLKIEIDASNGASDYGNKFGEPVITGFTRSYGQRLPNGERREWIKPIMFSGGIGFMDARHNKKDQPEVGMVVVKAGGPAYRIGMGGGSASSMVGGDNKQELDFSAVQRGDAEMGQKLNRIIRACVENEMFAGHNPIVSVHDQGAGGAGNVLKEIADPLGAKIHLQNFHVGDPTLSAMEIWGAEYQEQDAILMRSEDRPLLEKISARERLPVAFVGDVTGDGYAVLIDDRTGATPVNLPLEKVLQKMPPKTFYSDRIQPTLMPISLPSDLTVNSALDRVLRLLSVGSKRFLTNKVDRAVTGLVARQQCVGPLHTPLSDVAIISSGYFGVTGAATSIGEQPIKGFISPAAMAYLTVGEALTNLMWASITSLGDVKCSGNWMWAAKLKGEGAALYDAALAMHDTMIELGIAIDGGKDSLSMAAKAPSSSGDELVKGPGTLVVSTYVTCDDITKTVTPDLKLTSQQDSAIVYIDLGANNNFLGGSALAHVYSQVGNDSPHLDTKLLKSAFETVQLLVKQRLLTAGHDRSDGGLITSLIEMSLGGNRGMNVTLPTSLLPAGFTHDALFKLLFSEELGAAFECHRTNLPVVMDILKQHNVPAYEIGYTCVNTAGNDRFVVVAAADGSVVLDAELSDLSQRWEETSYRLEQLQANVAFVDSEMTELKKRAIGGGRGPQYRLSFTPSPTIESSLLSSPNPRVAIIREEGSNGDREMAAAFFTAGFEAWDIAMSDLIAGTVVLDERFKGVAFVGGFSYGDVLDSAKGWAGSIRFNTSVSKQFDAFYGRADTFSLGLCNGCQLMALLGWVPYRGIEASRQPRFIHNASGRFESRWVTVAIEKSNAIMLAGMEGSILGCWSQHGEGLAYFPDESILADVQANNLAPVRYVDDNGQKTNVYPYNPNGSTDGIASLISRDGRHLAMMPHPERSFLSWQWPHMPQNIQQAVGGLSQPSPWLKMFQNARLFCESNKS